MPHRLWLALLAALAALVFVLPSGARPAQNVLTGVVGPGYNISLTDESGQRVTHLDPGTYTINVSDKAAVHNFHLVGKGVNVKTGVAFTGKKTWTVRLAKGKYTYRSDATPRLKGSFAVK